jgi:hypothetical protein
VKGVRFRRETDSTFHDGELAVNGRVRSFLSPPFGKVAFQIACAEVRGADLAERRKQVQLAAAKSSDISEAEACYQAITGCPSFAS